MVAGSDQESERVGNDRDEESVPIQAKKKRKGSEHLQHEDEMGKVLLGEAQLPFVTHIVADKMRHVKFSTNSFNALLLRSPASSPRYHSNASPM